MEILHVAEPAVNSPTCTCPEVITDTGDLCRTCLAEYQDWRWECDRHQPEPEPQPDDDYPDESPELPLSAYYSPQVIRIGTLPQLLSGEVPASSFDAFRFSDAIYVEVREGDEIPIFKVFNDRESARRFAASLFGEGGYQELDDPFEDETFSALEYFNEYLDTTEEWERDEADARAAMERGR